MNRSTRTGRVLAQCFLFLSGATSLVYELVWSKHLANMLGNSGHAHALVLAVFMGGLALGAWLFGRRADRVKSPLFMYGLLELGIGLYALLFTPILAALGALYLEVAAPLPEGARIVPKLVLAGLSLLPPTLLMGGTLPALVRHFTQHLGSMQKELARLYAINSLGASLGVFLAGVRLVPNLGLEGSARAAALLNVVLALGAMALARTQPRAEGGASIEPPVEYPAMAARAALVGVALSGFAVMLYEITWIRLLSIVIGGTTYAFTLILTAFIAGIGLGSFWLTTRVKEGDSLRLFGRLQVALVVSVCVALPLYVRLPYYFIQTFRSLNRTLDTWPWFQLLTFFFCCAVLLVPTFFMGASFPAAARVATARVSELGRQLGGVYLWNTVGTVSGSLLGGLLLLPLVRMEGNFAVAMAVNLLAAWLAFRHAPSSQGRRLRSMWPVGASLVVAAVYLGSSAGWSRILSDTGHHRDFTGRLESFEAMKKIVLARTSPRLQADDIFATVFVGEDADGHRHMRINGKVDASNGGDSITMIAAGQLGVLLHEREVKNVLVIGSGAAITVGTILSHPVERVDLVEISPAVIQAARLFAPDNRNALEDPRVRITIDDAKTFLALSDTRYDLIVSIPSNPWVTGVSGLFSRDFFQVVKHHLADDGMLVQWIHTYESTEEIIQLVARTVLATFPHTTTWLGPQDLVLVARQRSPALNWKDIEQRMRRPEAAHELKRLRIDSLTTLLAIQMHSEEGLAEFAGEGPINTDDLNLLEYGSPVAYFVSRGLVPVKDERRGWNGGKRLHLHSFLQGRTLSAEEAAAIYGFLEQTHNFDHPLLGIAARMWAERAPDDSRAILALARCSLAVGELNYARELLEPQLALRPDDSELVAAYGFWVARHVSRTRSVFGPPPELGPALAQVRAQLKKAPAHRELLDAEEVLCELASPQHCPGEY